MNKKFDAEYIVKGIGVAVIGFMVPLIDKFPSFHTMMKKSENADEEFDFFMTAAGIGYSALLINDKDKFGPLLEYAGKYMKQLNLAIEDLFKFIENGKPTKELLNPTIGFWVLWNLKKSQPDDDEMKITGVIGSILEQIAIDFTSISK